MYSIHIRMLDGIRARSNGVILLRNGRLLGGDPYFSAPATTPSPTAAGKASC